MQDSPRYLILGGGAVVREFHLPGFALLGWLDRVKVVDPSNRAVDALGRAFPLVELARADFREALRTAAEEGYRAAIVALPNALHAESVDRALDLGLDVLCEKPLALTQSLCARLSTKAEARNRLLAVGMVRRLMPAVQAVKRAVAAGWIGNVQSVEIAWGGPFAWPSESGEYFKPENAGVLANLGVHSLDLVQYLFGELEPVAYTDDWAGGTEANAQFRLRTASDVKVSITLSYTTKLANQTRITGSSGEIWFDPDDARAYLRADGAVDAVLTSTKPFSRGNWPATLTSCFAEQISDFDYAVRSRTRPHATGCDAARTAALIDWASAHHRRSPRVGVMRSLQPPLQPGPIVVTGGTGFVGGHLLDQLVSQGHEDVRVPVRSYRSGANAGRFPVQIVRTDLLDAAAVRDVVRGARYVFHLAYGRDGPDAARVTTEGTQNVIEAAIDTGVEAVVVLSTTALFGRSDICADESFPYAPSNEYERLKAAAEQWTLARARSVRGTRLAVINSACVYGPGGRTFTELPARFLADGTFCWIENGSGIVNHVYVTNLVDAILRAATCEAAHGERFIVCDGSTTWRQFLGRLLGPDAERAASYTTEKLQSLVRNATPGPRDMVRAIVANPEMWRAVRENPRLAKVKAAAQSLWPGLSDRVRTIKDSSPEPGNNTRRLPPSWIADLYGPARTRVTSAKARRVLAWAPNVDTEAGLAHSRQWLQGIGLLPRDIP